jgi:hypothetical protein
MHRRQHRVDLAAVADWVVPTTSGRRQIIRHIDLRAATLA